MNCFRSPVGPSRLPMLARFVLVVGLESCGVFVRQDPKVNGLLWSYHWYQMVLYDALLATNDRAGGEAMATRQRRISRWESKRWAAPRRRRERHPEPAAC